MNPIAPTQNSSLRSSPFCSASVEKGTLVRTLTTPAWAHPDEAGYVHNRLLASVHRAGQVFHPGLLGCGVSGGRIVRPFVPGETAADILRRGGAVSLSCALEMANQIGAALQSLHAAGITHGGVTLGNIHTDGESWRLLDPGIRAPQTQFQLAGAACTRRASSAPVDDLAGLALLFEALLTGAVPQRTVVSRCIPKPLRRVLECARREGYTSAEALLRDLQPRRFAPALQVVWRPAAVAGIFGALATLGGEGGTQVPLRSAPSETKQNPAPAQAVKPTETDDTLPVLSESDLDVLRTAAARRGVGIFQSSGACEAFALTEAQREKILGELNAARESMARLVDDAAASQLPADPDATARIRVQLTNTCLSTLNAQQIARWNRIADTPFALNR